MSTTAMEVEISGNPVRRVKPPTRYSLGNRAVKFTGGTPSAVRLGTMIRVRATQGSTARTATSAWFPFRRAAPSLDCECVPSYGSNTCGNDGCGGSCGTCGAGTA